MNKQETKQILTILKVNYPQSFKNWDREQSQMYLDLWSEAFKDDDVNIVINAVKTIIYSDTREFAPNIGQVKDKIFSLTHEYEMTEYEAWGLVKKALKNSGYHAREEFDKLPQVVQRLVGEPRQLYDWSMMNTDTVDSVIASNFMRSYKVRAKHEKEYLAIPTQVKESLGLEDFRNKMSMQKAIPEKPMMIEVDSITRLEMEYEAELLSLGLKPQDLLDLREYADNKIYAYKDVLVIFLAEMRDGATREQVMKALERTTEK